MSWFLAHWVAILGIAALVLSEAMPFLPSKANGILQAILNVMKAILSQTSKASK